MYAWILHQLMYAWILQHLIYAWIVQHLRMNITASNICMNITHLICEWIPQYLIYAWKLQHQIYPWISQQETETVMSWHLWDENHCWLLRSKALGALYNLYHIGNVKTHHISPKKNTISIHICICVHIRQANGPLGVLDLQQRLLISSTIRTSVLDNIYSM